MLVAAVGVLLIVLEQSGGSAGQGTVLGNWLLLGAGVTWAVLPAAVCLGIAYLGVVSTALAFWMWVR